MVAVFNILVLIFVLIIAYWWANQGPFSAFLHLICVIAAGAITFGFWEPLTTGLLLRGTAFDNFAWGVSFLGLFGVSLLILRVLFDRLIRADLQFPEWAKWATGAPIGAASGALTVGMIIIGAGFVQSTRGLLGFEGAVRDSRDAQIREVSTLWFPVHEWTYKFFAGLSSSSLSTGTPLKEYYPDLHLQSVSLIRDSFNNGRGQLALKPSAARVSNFSKYKRKLDDRKKELEVYGVSVTFDASARDHGEQLTLSSAQIRLIGQSTGSEPARVAHPGFWVQSTGQHQFDDISHYITSEPGQQQMSVVIEFDVSDLAGQTPRFIQIRGTRYALPKMQQGEFGNLNSPGSSLVAGETATVSHSAKPIDSTIRVTNSIRPIQSSANIKPSGIDLTDKFISGGDGDFPRSGGLRPTRSLLIQGIYETPGTRCVQIDVSRDSDANIFGAVREEAGADAALALVDSDGRTYMPIGFIHSRPDNMTRIKVDMERFVRTINDMPQIPTSGKHNLKLLFNVTVGKTIVGLKCGELTVGTCQVEVTDTGR